MALRAGVNYPDWYPDWRHDAVHELQDKNARLRDNFRLEDWPRYDYDLDVGTLTFSDRGPAKVIATIQIAGSTSGRSRDWLWAWANSHWPPQRVTDSEAVRLFGAEHNICELTHQSIVNDDVNGLGWELTAVMVKYTEALGAYRPPDEHGGGLFLVYKTMAWAG